MTYMLTDKGIHELRVRDAETAIKVMAMWAEEVVIDRLVAREEGTIVFATAIDGGPQLVFGTVSPEQRHEVEFGVEQPSDGGGSFLRVRTSIVMMSPQTVWFVPFDEDERPFNAQGREDHERMRELINKAYAESLVERAMSSLGIAALSERVQVEEIENED